MDLSTLTNEELSQLLADAREELDRRVALAGVEDRIDAIIVEARTAAGVVDGGPWVQPTGAHDAYPRGSTVTHNGKIWESLIGANVWAPGVSGWREVVSPGSYPDWAQPTGAHDAYALGAIVRFAGNLWQSTVAANVWAPNVYGWVPYVIPSNLSGTMPPPGGGVNRNLN